MKRPYPLQWPDGWARTPAGERRHSKFGSRAGIRVGYTRSVSPYEAAKEVLAECKLLGAVNVVITSQLPTRHDGLPYSDGRSDDPGIAVWMDHEGNERVFPCDCWHTPGENLRAIALSIAAMRGLGRWGMANIVTRAFSGFAALPPGEDADAPNGAPKPRRKRAWRDVLGGAWPREMSTDEILLIAKARHRNLIKTAHPDHGGDPEIAAELNVALAEALAEFKEQP